MPIGMLLVMIATIAGIVAMFLVWRELDRIDEILEMALIRRGQMRIEEGPHDA